MKTLMLFAAMIGLGDAVACSPAIEEPVEIDPSAAYEGEVEPAKPVARVVSINRGRPAKQGESLCVEISSVTVAVRNDSPRLPFYFEFREVGGTAPDLIFQEGLYAGTADESGDRLFTFYWPELSANQKPVDLRVEITPVTRSGIRGPNVTINVNDVES